MSLTYFLVFPLFLLVLSLLLHSGPHGFGFIQYVDPADAAEAKYQMDGQASQGRQLKIVFGEESRKKAQKMRAWNVEGSSFYYVCLFLNSLVYMCLT